MIIPEHLHALWTLPPGDVDYLSPTLDAHQNRIFTADPQEEGRSTSRASKGERGIWQRRYWEHCIRDETDFARHVKGVSV